MIEQIKNKWGKGAVLFIALIAVVALSGCSNSVAVKTTDQTTGVVKQPVGTDTDKDGIPDNAEVVLGTDPKNTDTDGDGIDDKTDQNPVLVDNIFQKSTGANDFSIQSILVENNVDAITQKGTSDHLEVFLKSNSKVTITDFSIYYEYNDLVDNTKQSYEMSLTGFVLNAGETKSVHLDTGDLPGHFRTNPNSSYYQSQNAKDVKVIISATGHQAQESSVKKDKGGAETAD